MIINKVTLSTNNKKNNFTFGAKVHIIDGFLHADNMEHFAKASLKQAGKISDVQMHYVNCNRIDINSKQIGDIEDKLKSISSNLRRGDYLVIPGLASVSILNLQDRIKEVLRKNINLTAENLKYYKETLLNYLKEIYDFKNYYSSNIKYLDKNNQDLEYTYGVIEEINNLKNKGVNVYLPAGHGADENIKWKAKQLEINNELHKYIATGKDTNGVIRNLLRNTKNNNIYDFNLLSLSNAHIVNIKGKNGSDYIFSSQDGFANDSARGTYNFTPIRNSSGRLLGYSYHDENTVEYPYSEFKANDQISNLCKYVGLPRNKFLTSYSEDRKFKDYVQKGHPTSELADKLYSLKDVFDISTIKSKKLDMLGSLINKDGLIFDTNSCGKVIFQKTNCEGSDRPSVMQMWGSCFSSINAMVRDIKKSSNNSSSSYSNLINKGDKRRSMRDYGMAEYYYNEALNILHPSRTSLNYHQDAIEVYEKLYAVLKSNYKYSEAKGVANMLINLNSNNIKNLSVYDSTYMSIQSEIGDYYKELANFCERECEYYPAKVCRWASEELKKSSSYGDKIVQRRAELNQYIGDLYNECH